MKKIIQQGIYGGGLVASLLACAPIDSVIGSNLMGLGGTSETPTAGSVARGGAPNRSSPIAQGQGGATYDTPVSQGGTGPYTPPWVAVAQGGATYVSSQVAQGQGGATNDTTVYLGRGGATYDWTSIAQGRAQGGASPYNSTRITQGQGGTTYTSVPSTDPDESVWAPRVPAEVLPLTGTGPLAGAWDGPIWYQSPGYAGPPLNFFTVVLDDQHLRSLAFRGTFIDDVLRPTALSGLDNGGVNPAYAIESETFSANGFEIRYHNANPKSTRPMDTTTVRGQLREDGRLALDFAAFGVKTNGSEYVTTGSAALNKVGAARAPYTTIRGNWYSIVDVNDQGSVGPRRDELAIAFTEEGLLRRIRFQSLEDVMGAFGETNGEWPLSGSRLVHMDSNGYDYDAEVQRSSFGPTSFDFAIRIRDHAQPTRYDLVMTIVGNLDATGLVVDYHCEGIHWSAQIDRHAQGTLLP